MAWTSAPTFIVSANIGACAGGGTVVVKGGHYKTGPLLVAGAKGLTIEVQQGASLVAAFGPDDWPVTHSSRPPSVVPLMTVRVSRRGESPSGSRRS